MPDAMQWEDRIVQTELGGRILNDALPEPLQRLAPGTAVRVTVEPLTPTPAASGGTDDGTPLDRLAGHMDCEVMAYSVRQRRADYGDTCTCRPCTDFREALKVLTPPASAPGSGEDEWWEAAECEAWAQARQHASEIGWRDFDKAESVAAAATGSLRFATLSAIRRARSEGEAKGRREGLEYAKRHQPRHAFDWNYVERSLAALADDEGRGT